MYPDCKTTPSVITIQMYISEIVQVWLFPRYREVNKNNLLGGQFFDIFAQKSRKIIINCSFQLWALQTKIIRIFSDLWDVSPLSAIIS